MKRFLGNPIIVFIFLISLPPLGIFLMFQFTEWQTGIKMALAVIFSIIWIVAIITTINEVARESAMQNMRLVLNLI
ncbi:MAG: hypothetical protein RSC43_05640 [Clostridia bacterium]